RGRSEARHDRGRGAGRGRGSRGGGPAHPRRRGSGGRGARDRPGARRPSMSGRAIYGVGPVRELLGRRSRDIVALYVALARKARPGDPVSELARDARGRGVAVEARTRDELDALAGDRAHQGVVALVGEYPYAELEDLAAGGAAPALLVALDGV